MNEQNEHFSGQSTGPVIAPNHILIGSDGPRHMWNDANPDHVDLDLLLIKIDNIIKEAREVANGINRGTGGCEVALAITKLQEARMWGLQARHEIEQSEKNEG